MPSALLSALCQPRRSPAWLSPSRRPPMSDFYFANHVFVTSVKDFEPYLTTSTGAGKISKDDDLISSKAFHEVFASFLKELSDTDPVLSDYFETSLKHPCENLISLTLLLLHDIRSII